MPAALVRASNSRTPRARLSRRPAGLGCVGDVRSWGTTLSTGLAAMRIGFSPLATVLRSPSSIVSITADRAGGPARPPGTGLKRVRSPLSSNGFLLTAMLSPPRTRARGPGSRRERTAPASGIAPCHRCQPDGIVDRPASCRITQKDDADVVSAALFVGAGDQMSARGIKISRIPGHRLQNAGVRKHVRQPVRAEQDEIAVGEGQVAGAEVDFLAGTEGFRQDVAHRNDRIIITIIIRLGQLQIRPGVVTR